MYYIAHPLTAPQLIVVPTKPTIQTTTQSINQIIMLKGFITSVRPIYEALAGARSATLKNIREASVKSSFR